MAVRMLQRRGTTAQWEAANPVLGDGEMGIDKTAGLIKIGNGTDPWAELDIVYEATPSVLSVAGRAGDVALTSEDLEDLTAIGASVLASGSPEDVLAILGASATGTDILRAAGPTAVRGILGATTIGAAIFMAANAAAVRSSAGITQTGAAVATAVDAAAVRTAAGITTIGSSVVTAADAAAVRAATGAGVGNVIGTGVTKMVSLTQAAYDALTPKDAATLYVIVG